MELTIRKGAASATIHTLGAEMRAYTDAAGKDCLWSGDPAVWSGVSPHLFPNIGFLKNDCVTFEGTEYRPPKHGILRKREFEVASQSEDSCTLLLTDSEETRQVYPYAFSVAITHLLVERGFVTTYEVENRDKREMPFTLGGHTAFACPMNAGERFEDYQVCFDEPEEGKNLLVSKHGLICGEERIALQSENRILPLQYAYFDKKDTLVFAGLKSRGVTLKHKTTGHGMRFVFPQFTTLALWTKPGAHAPYLCIEPWIGLPAFENESGDFESKPYHVTLQPQQSFRAWYAMEQL